MFGAGAFSIERLEGSRFWQETTGTVRGAYDFADVGKEHTGVITTSGGALYWNQDGAGPQRLLPFSERTFSLSGTLVEFVPQDGPVTHLPIQLAEGEIKAVRRK
jgi:hypothetical protein